MPIANRWKSACRIVAKKVMRDNLALRRKFSEVLVSKHSPYFCKTSYRSPALKEVTVIDHKKKCLVNELQSVDENKYSLDEIPIAFDSNGRCHLNMDDEKEVKYGNVI